MIVSCGEALVDMVPHAVIGGGPLNVAVAAARLGAPAAFVGGISVDDHGQNIWAHLVAEGVNLDASARFDAPTARAIVEHVPHLVFRFEGDDTADTLLGSVDLSGLGEGPHLVHGGTLGMFRGATAEALARLVEAHAGVVSLDPNVRPQIIDDRQQWDHFHDRWRACTDIYKSSDEDLAWIYPDRSIESCAEELLASGVTAFIATRGSDGLTVFTAHGEVSATGPQVELVDTVGAGDTVAATFLASLWEDGARSDDALRATTLDQWRTYAERAVAAAAITCSRAGADVPHRHELAMWPAPS